MKDKNNGLFLLISADCWNLDFFFLNPFNTIIESKGRGSTNVSHKVWPSLYSLYLGSGTCVYHTHHALLCICWICLKVLGSMLRLRFQKPWSSNIKSFNQFVWPNYVELFIRLYSKTWIVVTNSFQSCSNI